MNDVEKAPREKGVAGGKSRGKIGARLGGVGGGRGTKTITE